MTHDSAEHKISTLDQIFEEVPGAFFGTSVWMVTSAAEHHHYVVIDGPQRLDVTGRGHPGQRRPPSFTLSEN